MIANDQVVFRGTRREVWQQLRKAVAAANGDGDGILLGLKLRIGNALLSQIEQDFVVKSRGGVGRDGIQWEPLKRSTIAQRRATPGDRKAAGLTKANANRGLLTASENKLWKQIFARNLSRLRVDMSEGAAKARAAQIAWAELKRLGAKTKLAVFGGRQVDILRDTGELLRSFAAGVDDQQSGAEGQIFEVDGNTISVGSNKKPWHHAGIPGKLPARPFWPLDGSIPPGWMPAIDAAAARGLSDALVMLLQKGQS